MRHILFALATGLTVALPLQAATAPTLWDATTFASRGDTLAPGYGRTAAADRNGDLYVVAAEGDGTQGCIVTLKYAGASGALGWRREACGGRGVSAVGLAVDASGNVIVLGNADARYRMIKYSGSGGSPMWDVRAAGGALDVAAGLALDLSGDVFVLGKEERASTEVWVAKHRAGDGAMAWQQPVDAGAELTPAGIATDGSGNAIIVGNYRNSAGDDDWTAAKLAGSSGAVLWRMIYDSGRRDVAAGIAVDSSGNFAVAGTSLMASGATAFRVVKNAGATGRTHWDRTIGAHAGAAAHAIGTDAAGNVVVTGAASSRGNEEMSTMKLAAVDGSLLWQSTHRGAASGRELGGALAIDAKGDVAVTGASLAAGGSVPEFRTIKYSGADGAERWSSAFSGQAAGVALVLAESALYAIGLATSSAQGTGLRVSKFADSDGIAAPGLNVQGLWWKESQSGWGVNLTQQGDVLFATWFTYDANGHPMWLVMSAGRRVGDNSYEGELYRTRGPAFNAVPFESAKVSASAVGTASFSFTDSGHGVFRYTVNGTSGASDITRQVFSTLLPTCAYDAPAGATPNYQDLWWYRGGQESGWGVNITHQGDTIFLTWFTYAGDGAGMWLVGSNIAKTGNATYAGTLYRTVGPSFDSAPWNAAQVGVAAAGHATLVFSDADNGTFTYTLDGVSQSKQISRQVFASPKTVCR